MILFIDACARRESRTRGLAKRYLEGTGEAATVCDLSLAAWPETDEAFLRMRDECVARNDFSSPIFQPARDFAAADEILIAAPYWDLSFPSVLKRYVEQINVRGVTFEYSPEGVPLGLCRARRLTYVTTAGGPILSDAFGFGYIEALAREFYHIPQIDQVKAEGLDLQGADVEGLLRRAEAQVDRLLARRAADRTA